MEIGKNNRIEQTPIHNLNLPANPHGYWLFGSLDFQSGNMISSRSRYDLFDSPPYISTVFRALRKCKKNTQEQYEILKFDPAKTLINQGFSAEKTARANAHFECCTFDHSDNSPYLFSSVLSSKNCSKIRWGENRRESKKYSILRFSVLRNIKEKRGDEIHRFRRNFKSASLRPLRYISMLYFQGFAGFCPAQSRA